VPEHHKTIADNEDGSYHVTLSVTGAEITSQESNKADVVIVFDRSNSMNAVVDSSSGKTRLTVAKEATQTLIDSLYSSSSDVNVSFIRFATRSDVLTGTDISSFNSDASGTNVHWFTSSDEQTLEDLVASNSFSTPSVTDTNAGATNWEEALQDANAAVSTGRSDADKYIIFVSDGNPTVRIDQRTDETDGGYYAYDATEEKYYQLSKGGIFSTSTSGTVNYITQSDGSMRVLYVQNSNRYTFYEADGTTYSISLNRYSPTIEWRDTGDSSTSGYWLTYTQDNGKAFTIQLTDGTVGNQPEIKSFQGSVHSTGQQSVTVTYVENSTDGTTTLFTLNDGQKTYSSSDVTTSTSSTDTHRVTIFQNGERDLSDAWGQGMFDPNGYDYQRAVDQALNRADGVTLYTVSTATIASKMDDLAQDANTDTKPAQYYDGTDEAKLKAAFEDIAQQITKAQYYTNVTIQDKLSDYVVFNENGTDTVNASTFKVYRIDSAGTKTQVTNATVNYDSETGLITYQPENGGRLEDRVTYTVEFDVWPNQLAFDREANIQNGLDDGDTAYGQDGTDGSGVGVDGGNIYSNGNDDSKLTYSQAQTVNGEETILQEDKEADFEDPVVVVPTSSITVTKEWVGGAAEDSVTIKLQWKDEMEEWVDYTVDGTVLTAKLTSNNNWSHTFSNLPAGPYGHDYRVVETSPDPSSSGWSASYTYSVADTNGGTGSEYTNAYESSASSEGILLKGRAAQSASAKTTNTRTSYSLQVIKKGRASDQSDDEATLLQGATFQLFEASVDENNVVTYTTQVGGDQESDTNGKLTFSGVLTPGKTYLLKESVTPAGYVTANPYVLVVGTDGTVTLYKTTVDGSTITVDTTSGGSLSTVENDSSTYTMTVTNLSVGDLPGTSGPGVYPLVAGGCGLLAVAGWLLRRRLSR
jgi:hypothetical protein